MTDHTDADASGNATDQSGDDATRRDFMKAGAAVSGAAVLGTGAVVAANSSDAAAEADDFAAVQTDHMDDEDGDQEADSPFAAVEFTNQESSGTDVMVDETILSQSGYVAFHDASLLAGEIAGSVVGVTDYLEGGVHYQTDASLFEVEGAEFEQTALEGTSPLIAMPHLESGDDETYDFVASEGSEDGPFAEAGLPVIDLAFVTAGEDATGTATGTPAEEGTATPAETATEAGTETATEAGTETGTAMGSDEEMEPFATVDFANQQLDDEGAMVGEVVLSEGGFVVLHDARLFDGDALGSVVGVSEYLEPGRHRMVEVPIDSPDEITEVALPAPPLVAMPHMDSNDNETYDFVTSEGADDGPYTKAGAAVVDIALVTQAETAGTATGTSAEDEDTETPGEDETETPEGTPDEDEDDET